MIILVIFIGSGNVSTKLSIYYILDRTDNSAPIINRFGTSNDLAIPPWQSGYHCEVKLVVIRAIERPNLVPVVDAISVVIVATCRLNRQVLTANFACSGALAAPLVILTSMITALVSAEDDDGAFVSDTHCIDTRD
jgi:hypothetical protein